MSIPVKPEDLAELETFISLCTANPAILQQPQLAFVKSFIEHFGGSIPKDTSNESPSKKSASTTEAAEATDANEATEATKATEANEATEATEANEAPEAAEATEAAEAPEPKQEKQDTTEVIEADLDTPQPMGDPTLEPTEENVVEAAAKRLEAVSAFTENDYEKAIKLYTESIELNPQVALVYAKRGQIYLLMEKSHACIRDCNRALELNPDSAAAHKFRGRAYQLLGKFEEAAKDLRLACKFDFDEQANEWLREVTPMAREIEMRKILEKRDTKVNSESEKQETTKETKDSRFCQTESSGEAPGIGDFSKFFTDADILKSLMDPEVGQAFNDICTNPLNILKYQNNPKIMALINTVGSKFGGAGGIPGAKGAPGAPTTTPKPEPQDDDGLD